MISGLHISFLGGLVFLVVRRLTKRRLLQFVLPAIIVWSYSIAVGAEASVARAALMFTFVGLATIVFRQATYLNALGAAALILLISSPKEIFDPSFQLTFLSVLAIVAIAWPLLLSMSAIGAWHPTRSTPYPPVCSPGVKTLCDSFSGASEGGDKSLPGRHTITAYSKPQLLHGLSVITCRVACVMCLALSLSRRACRFCCCR